MDFQRLRNTVRETGFAPENAERANAIIASGEASGLLSPEQTKELIDIFEEEADARKKVAQLLEDIAAASKTS
jgi:hypothetical protein